MVTPLAPLRDARSQATLADPLQLPVAGQPGTGGGGASSDAKLFDALVAPGPQDAVALPAPAPHHHHGHVRPTQARRLSSRSRRSMSAGDDDAEIETSPAESGTEQAAQAGLAVAKGASEHDGGGAGSGHRRQERDPARKHAQPGGRLAVGGVPLVVAPAAARAASGPDRAAGPARGNAPDGAAGPARTATARIVPARLPPQTPAMLERNATAKLPLATRMARAHPHKGVSALFAFTGQSLYSPAKRLAGMLWWADWRAMRGYSRLASREAPRAGRLKPAAKLAYTPSFVPAPRAAPVFRQPLRGRVALQRWEDRPDTVSISAFPVHCGEPYGLRTALAWQTRIERRSLRTRTEFVAHRDADAAGAAA